LFGVAEVYLAKLRLGTGKLGKPGGVRPHHQINQAVPYQTTQSTLLRTIENPGLEF